MGGIANRGSVCDTLDHAAFGCGAAGGAKEKADGDAKDFGKAAKVGYCGQGLATLDLTEPADGAPDLCGERGQRQPARLAQSAYILADLFAHPRSPLPPLRQGVVKTGAEARLKLKK
jgi:hypothetical protein